MDLSKVTGGHLLQYLSLAIRLVLMECVGYAILYYAFFRILQLSDMPIAIEEKGNRFY